MTIIVQVKALLITKNQKVRKKNTSKQGNFRNK